MKSLNTMKFMSNAIENLTEYKTAIAAAETFKDAQKQALAMMGYIDCLTTFLNTMICVENNDFTGDFGELLDDWMHKLYQELAIKADETKQPSEVILKLLNKRDEYEIM